ncbi:hypothetical protein [Flavobacterium sp.]|uniref:hypothetical protein n=1 Tax=Flavobacterium sp. TaxID=239 RepID=UPI0035B20DAE
MKRLFLLGLVLFSISGFSQDSLRVEKSIFGIQTGLLGFWAHNEARLSDEIALRTELGFDLGVAKSSLQDKDIVVLIPSIRLEPRWYYNLENRVKKGKSIAKNSANFFALNTTWNPDFFYITNENKDNFNVISTLAIIPKWGLKRTYGSHFTFETGFGLGYFFYLEEYNNETGNVGVDLHLRIGYTF